MMVREPVVSGPSSFYPDDPDACLEQVRGYMPADLDVEALPARPVGGLVPHAGWAYSGSTAARVFAALAARTTPSTVVLFGTDHWGTARPGAMFGTGRWVSPLGDAEIDERLAERIAATGQLVNDDPHAHNREHSIEVQIPFVKHVWPEAKILPISVAADDRTVEIGRAVGRTIEAYKTDVMVIGSTDLTHYGQRYGFAPKGVGPGALAWAKDVNDRRLIDLILAMKVDAILPEVAAHHSACGGGPIAATLAACQALGATQAVLLEHTTSYEVASRAGGESADMSVGYAGIVIG